MDWPKEIPKSDHRDWVLGYDSNRKRRDEIAQEAADLIRKQERVRILSELKESVGGELTREVMAKLERTLAPSAEEDALRVLADSKLMDLTEFGRAVHAEMDALIACTRLGIRAMGARVSHSAVALAVQLLSQSG